MESLLGAREVAKLLRCHPQSVYKNKELPCVKIPGVGKRYQESALRDFIEQNTVKIVPLPKPDIAVNSFKLTNLDRFDRMYLRKKEGGICGSMRRKKTRWNYGFGSVYARKAKQGKDHWYVDYSVSGKRVREVLKGALTRAEAVHYLQEKIAEVFSKAPGSAPEKRQIIFSELAERYLNDYAKVMKRSYRSDFYTAKAHLIPFFGVMKVSKITCLLLEKYRAERLGSGVKKSSINRELAILSRIFSLGIDWGLASENPVQKIKFFSEKDNIKERILSREEETRLLQSSAGHLRAVLVVALNTGMRLGEILGLRWNNVDLKHSQIKVSETKSGRTRFISMNSVLRQTLERVNRENSDGGYLFTNPRTGEPLKGLDKPFCTACRKAGIENLRFHDLRHTFATRLVENGVNLITVKELLGHSSVRITERYIHPNKSLKQNAVDMLVQEPDRLAQNCHMGTDAQPGTRVTNSLSMN